MTLDEISVRQYFKPKLANLSNSRIFEGLLDYTYSRFNPARGINTTTNPFTHYSIKSFLKNLEDKSVYEVYLCIMYYEGYVDDDYINDISYVDFDDESTIKTVLEELSKSNIFGLNKFDKCRFNTNEMSFYLVKEFAEAYGLDLKMFVFEHYINNRREDIW